jgi:hypothetical protein
MSDVIFTIPSEDFLNVRLAEFKKDLPKFSVPVLAQKHLNHGDCCLLSSEAYFELKLAVAKEFEIHPNEVVMVGSAKLGFSIVPWKRYRLFNDSSDIDLAIVSPKLFEQVWAEVHDYSYGGSYWPDRQSFCEYLFQGWIRPDKLPPDDRFGRSQKWWEYFRGLTNSQRFGKYKIRAGLYKSWHFLEKYQSICIEECKE